jgi:two-component system alkaline phosphatase synthesis response regulator PhoP
MNFCSILRYKKVLIVEDDPRIREIYGFELEDHEVLIDNAENGKLAYQMILNGNYDAVITDVRMPKGNGIELLISLYNAKLRKQPVKIVISGYTDLDKQKAVDLGAYAYFPKPFDFNQLIACLKQAFLEAQNDRKSA